jgi:hypothetical protein
VSVVAAAASGCGSKKERPVDDPPPRGASLPEPHDEAPAGKPATPPDFPEGTRSLQLMKTVAVRLAAADDAKRIGTIAVDTRVGWTATAKGKGCTRPWVEIKPRGWVCSDHLSPSTKPPYGREVPMLDRGAIVPGNYGKVTGANAVTYTIKKEPAKKKDARKPDPKAKISKTAKELEAAGAPPGKLVEDKPVLGSLTVRLYEELAIEGKQFYRIHPRDKELVLKSAVSKLTPSAYMGARLGDDTGWAVPIAFVWPRSGGQLAWTTALPGRGVKRQVPTRTAIPILEAAEGKDGKPLAYRIGPEEWIGVGDVRVYEPAPPPPLLRPGERWIDIDLDRQILVAFEGDVAVYATMISSGKQDHTTTTGLYRMWLKESEADMKNLRSEDPYSVATVPWTQFFYPEEDLALHTAYWHDGFGKPRSRGCINLAPRDARWLYYWTEPQVPPGWTMTTGVVELPGSVVRVRSAADPNPEWKGYARKVVEARQSNAPVRP